MKTELFEVLKAGLSTTVQDLGRTGYQQYGVTVSGAMDSFALQVANILVGNKRGDAVLEVAFIGPELRVLRDTILAVCGADLSPSVDGIKLPMWKSHVIKKGQIVHFGKPKCGAYAYVSISGGIKVPDIIGSKSTYMKAKLGGFHGRSLQREDIVESENKAINTHICRGLLYQNIPDYEANSKIRVILGPDHKMLESNSVEGFFKEPYFITSLSDRMGYRLKGPKLIHQGGADIISDAILPGTIQVPASGNPIVLLADRQTTGGYCRIGTVISIDLPFIAQKIPGKKVNFSTITVEEAQRLYIKQEKLLRRLEAGVVS